MVRDGSTTGVGAPAPSPRRRRGDGRVAAVFLAPWFAGLILVTAGPMAASAYLSLTDYDLIQAPRWLGLGNFRELWSDPRFWSSLQVTGTYVLVSVPLQLTFALVLAMLL